jgi:CRISPR-associated exonuclease Cas4
MSLYLPLVLLLVALILFWHSNRQLKRAGLPGGRIIYTDTRGWGKLAKPLIYASLELTGKPDYLVEKEGSIIPVEVKSSRSPAVPYDSHIYQLAAYCLLVEKTFGKRPAYGIIHYANRDFAIDYNSELEVSLLDLLADIKRDEHKQDMPRSHEQPARCMQCGFRKVCDQSLT